MSAVIQSITPTHFPDWMQTPSCDSQEITLSFLSNVFATEIKQYSTTWGELAAGIANPKQSRPDKFDCELIKLASFGTVATASGCLRHDANVVQVFGVEGDYDGEAMPLSEAVDKLTSAGVAAVLYTSANHTPTKPRWRVLCPLSAPVAPDARASLLARLDALLGTVLSQESYVISQTYFHGRVKGAPFESAIVEGQPLDLAGLPDAVVPTKVTKQSEVGNWQQLPDDIDAVLGRLPCPKPADKDGYLSNWLPTVLGTLNSFGHAAVPHLVRWSLPWYVAKYPTHTATQLEQVATWEISKRIQSEGQGKTTWENVRERRGLSRSELKGFAAVPNESAQPSPWPEPQPVPNIVLAAPVFDYSMLPEPFARWVEDIATRKSWSPDYVAVAVMSLCGSLLGRKVALLPDDNDPTWLLVPNVWGLLIGDPSSAKSPSIEEALRLLAPVSKDAEAVFEMQNRTYVREMKFHRAKVKSMESKRTKALADDDEMGARAIHDQIGDMEETFDLKRPRRRKFFTTDATYECLFSLMVDNPQGLMLYKDEMSNLMAQMTMENFAALRSFLLAAWKGTTQATKDRIKDEENPLPTIEACISIIGGLQPSLLPRFLGGSRDGSAGDDGFPQRFGLMVWPDIPPLAHNETPKDMEAENAAASVVRRMEQWPLKEQPITYSFDGPTQRAFNVWNSKLISDNRTGVTDPALVTWLGKYPKAICSIALITTLAEGRTTVDASAWGKAMKWEKYLRGHLARVMDYSTRRATQHANNIIRKIADSVPNEAGSILNKHGEMVYLTSRTLTNRQLPGCSTTRETDDLLEWLEELGYLRFRGAGTAPGVRKLWEVNPAATKK